MIARILNLQGMIGIAAAAPLSVLLLVKAGEVRHWRKQSAQFERSYLVEQSAAARTVGNYRAAAEAARQAEQANATRVAADQRIISERTTHVLETCLGDARARAQRLQLTAAAAATGRAPRAAPLPAAGTATGAARAPAPQDGFSLSANLSLEDRLIATEQAIQLDELIKWVNAQAALGE